MTKRYELPKDYKPPVYNPMTGTRRDLEVEKEDGPAAKKTHDRWTRLRIKALEALIADPTRSDFARELYRRELARLQP